MDIKDRPEDPRAALQQDLHALLLEAEQAVETFEASQEADAKETPDDERREAILLKSSEVTRLKGKFPELSQRWTSAAKATKTRAADAKETSTALAAAMTAFKKEVAAAGKKLVPK